MRYDQFEDKVSDDSFDDGKVSSRLGVIYRPLNTVSIFAQWADSYLPQNVTRQSSEAGGPFEATTGTITEAGLKAELFEDRLFFVFSMYDIVRENFLQSIGDTNGDGVEEFAPVGEVISTGAEIELVADITDNWAILASYAHNNARITEDNGGGGIRDLGGPDTNRFANAPEDQFGFWTRYQIPVINTAFAFGGDYVGDQLSLSGQPVQSYFIADASIIWEYNDFEVLLRVDNLFDEEYAESGFLSRTGHFPGDPRSMFVEVSKNW